MNEDPIKDSLRQTIGATIREARLRQGLTQEEVADRLGIATEVFGRMERGTSSPSIYTLHKLCVTLSISADKMLSTASAEPVRPTDEVISRHAPESRHMRRMLRRARKLTPHSLRLLCQLAAALPKKPRATAKSTRD